MEEIIVGVSGINAVDNPGPGVGVARSLKEKNHDLNIKVVGLAYDAMEPGIYLDWLMDKSYIMPYPSGKHEMFIDRLLYIKQNYGLDFVFPNLDAELPLYIKYADELNANGIKTFLPDNKQFRLRGKDKLPEVAKAIDTKIPKTKIITSYEDLIKAIEEIGLPIMVKGAFYKAYRAYTTQEAVANYHHIIAEWGYPVIAQQVVTGEEMNVVGVGDGEGGLLGAVGIKKIWITSLGKIWTGVTIKNDNMLDAVAKFVKEYKWKGPFEFECIVDGNDIYLIEINPRFPAWSYFATGLGINMPANILKKAFDLPVNPANDYEAGKLFIRYTYEIITDMAVFQNIVTRGEN
ncbi:MAG: carboxylate--amine ligase [Desulfobacterales bacterium]|nr:carboxylate--amine ligase [Desulfobacterales bacterium]